MIKNYGTAVASGRPFLCLCLVLNSVDLPQQYSL